MQTRSVPSKQSACNRRRHCIFGSGTCKVLEWELVRDQTKKLGPELGVAESHDYTDEWLYKIKERFVLMFCTAKDAVSITRASSWYKSICGFC
jgi:hypothetical protein